jgi:hypothetical protein
MTSDLFRHSGPERSSSARDWRAARLEAFGLGDFKENWDGEGALPVSKALILSAINFFKTLERDGCPAPDSVYPLANGSVMAEWHYSDQTVVSAEIRSSGRAEVLVWHPERPSVFEAVLWSDAHTAHPRPVKCGGDRNAWDGAVSPHAASNLPLNAVVSLTETKLVVADGVSSLHNDERLRLGVVVAFRSVCRPRGRDEKPRERYTDGRSFSLAA